MGLFIMFNYCQLVQVFVSPSNVGVSLSCIFELFMFMTAMYLLTYNTYQAGVVKEQITRDVVVESWNK